MEAIGAAAQDNRPVSPMSCRVPWRPDARQNGEPCALKGACTVRGEAQGYPRKRHLAPTLPRPSALGLGGAATRSPRARSCLGTRRKYRAIKGILGIRMRNTTNGTTSRPVHGVSIWIASNSAAFIPALGSDHCFLHGQRRESGMILAAFRPISSTDIAGA
jgi:hypothetical protein